MQIKFTALAIMLFATALSGCGGGGGGEGAVEKKVVEKKKVVHPFPLNQNYQLAASTN